MQQGNQQGSPSRICEVLLHVSYRKVARRQGGGRRLTPAVLREKKWPVPAAAGQSRAAPRSRTR